MKKGFTLIELLVVVLIMGILASVAMPQYFKSVEKSRASEAISILTAIASAQDRQYMQTGTYTGSLMYLDVGISNFSYFTVQSVGYAVVSGPNGPDRFIRVARKDSAGGGLGSYLITLRVPEVPGTGGRSWYCSPESAGCKSFLPIVP